MEMANNILEQSTNSFLLPLLCRGDRAARVGHFRLEWVVRQGVPLVLARPLRAGGKHDSRVGFGGVSNVVSEYGGNACLNRIQRIQTPHE